MTSLITLFDTITNTEFPNGAAAYAGYVDGRIGNQPNYAHIVSEFPHAEHLSITLTGANADVADVENGAMVTSHVPAWYRQQVARGIDRPVIYASASKMKTEILPLLTVIGVPRSKVRLWTAHYEDKHGAHICGPGKDTCGQLPVDADGTQWTQNYQGRNLDASLLVAGFFGSTTPAKPPANWVFDKVRNLTATAGKTSVRLYWSSPATPMPKAVEHYQIVIRLNGKDVNSYPRVDPKNAGTESWQGGSLKPKTKYEARVRAVAEGDSHESPWETVEFTTTG